MHIRTTHATSYPLTVMLTDNQTDSPCEEALDSHKYVIYVISRRKTKSCKLTSLRLLLFFVSDTGNGSADWLTVRAGRLTGNHLLQEVGGHATILLEAFSHVLHFLG